MTIPFDSETQETTFHSPLEEFESVSVPVDVREDPLTGRQTRIVRDNFVLPEGQPDIESVVTDDDGCFFCPGMVGEATPTYPEWMDVDRGTRGEATSFPNLNPYGAHSNVVVLTEDHYVPPDEFTVEQFADGLALALAFVRAALAHDGEAEHASINMNFLRPAGSSIVHPHVQTLVDDRGTNEQADRVTMAREYYEDEGSTYWQDLIAAERDSDRYVGSTGDVEWLAPFAPKHHRHVRGIGSESGVPGPEDAVVEDLASGVVNVLAYYAEAGLNSFNFTLQMTDDDPASHPVIDIVARSVFDQYYWSDSPFFTVLHDESVVDVPPETYAADVADHW